LASQGSLACIKRAKRSTDLPVEIHAYKDARVDDRKEENTCKGKERDGPMSVSKGNCFLRSETGVGF